MKIMNCPLNGPRNISEFVTHGEVLDMPEPNRTTDTDWADYLWMSSNDIGIVREWWCHVPTAYWFIAERHTVTDEILRTYPASEIFKDRVDFAEKETAQ
jgi:sarcosine oxidase subunit delta